MSCHDLHNKIEDVVHTCYGIVEKHYKRHFPRPTIKLDLRGRCAGQAWSRKNLIRLNRYLLDIEYDVMIKQTIPHEIAHLVINALYGRGNVRSHGKEWQQVMSVLGIPADRCHSMAAIPARVTHRPHLYICGCRYHQLTNRTHNTVLAGNSRICTKCRETIRPVDLNEVEL